VALGRQDIRELGSADARRAFLQAVLTDIQALERMLEADVVESGVRRIGAEQELFLVDASGAPAPVAMKVLRKLGDPRFVTELAQFNLEINLPPLLLEGACFSEMEATLGELIACAREAAAPAHADVVLAGILPTLSPSDLTARNMSPDPRYHEMDRALAAMRGQPLQIHIRGLDELRVVQDSLMLESSNCSFQVHLQTSPREFPLVYNAAQAVAAPVLAAATNSPLLLGRRLWHETRLALFQQSTDTRVMDTQREMLPRVTFGRRWVERSVLEIYREDVARFRPIFADAAAEDPFAALARGEAPQLMALRLHNGTVWRWNRPCYGVTDGRPHLRIENRLLPSGPSVVDQVANAAFWLGVLRGTIARGLDVTERMPFESAHLNLVAAARSGLDATLHWFDGRTVPADHLIETELLPLASAGLEAAAVSGADRERYLGLIAERVASRRTGSRWALDSLAAMTASPTPGTPGERHGALVRAMIDKQREGRPAHTWELATLPDARGRTLHYARVEQFMTTDVLTVQEDDPLQLVAHLMDYKGIRHVPVEDGAHRLVGMISYRSLLRLLARGPADAAAARGAASSVMAKDPVAISPDTSTVEAVETMMKHRVSCLPVVRDGRLVGIISERDLIALMRDVLLERLRAPEKSARSSKSGARARRKES
jgi:CBS domain-containing protein